MNYKKLSSQEAKFIVFADLGYGGGYIDVFENEETAREKDGLEYIGELKGLSEYYDL